MNDPLKPIKDLIARLWDVVDGKPTMRWGTVLSVSPLTVLLDPGMGDAVSARSAVGGHRVGDRVYCAEQNRRVTVVAGSVTQIQGPVRVYGGLDVDGVTVGDDTGWVPLVPLSGFTGAEALAVRRINGVVYMRGMVTRDAGAFSGLEVVLNLPPGFRIAAYARFPVAAYTSSTVPAGMAAVNTNGNIQLSSAGTGSDVYRLSSITYPTG